MKMRLAAGLLACSISALAVSASADTIRATSGFGPNHAVAKDVYPTLFKKLEELTDGRWTGQDTPSGLVAPNEMSTGLRDGVTEFGALLMPYFVAEYPESVLVSELSMLGSSAAVVSSAVTEYIATCAPCQAEFTRNGQIYLGSDTTPLYDLLSTKPVKTLGDMKGLKVRSGSPFYAAFIESVGGAPAQMPSSELFESLSQGVIDATFSSPHEIIANRLGDVVDYVTEIEQGVFNGAAITTASAMLWDRMDAEDRMALATAAQYGIATGMAAFDRQIEEVRAGDMVEFIEPDQDLIDARDTFNADRLANAASILEGRGVSDAQAKIDRYKALIDKWEELVTPGMTPEELGALRTEEIWSKIDLTSYGS
ncbi:C4-dicarboxylate TRAP transporter substrate-binding protein [Yangia mangrovi]|uniref:C4-dicarboxylate TRAP transporter substrate-binding protein n=3 Tax=Alloyangia mangrovi TaxID=1779329 RepID=A0ABT2KHI9_9RHOB|nr:C4-dicarboxylate TRAP transporter substrate-binding protein [Alloyangia mangrovi]MCA0941228.1 C4-dicarboxylate TRAP transporter substrate-binding protein [Alloyangia pacifica]MCA0945506.1 C4-dicarboxylate TRAP transporter substrate-binding protein [Alloyangia pacifica]MCT4369825.1 C4-dicarboxylate TRAP transporter substrate-binding protein [Alloyangia mangrovi]